MKRNLSRSVLLIVVLGVLAVSPLARVYPVEAAVPLSSETFADLYEKSLKHFVSIDVLSEGHGSGFVLSEDGYIVTNAHVVGSQKKVRVTLWDNKRFEAKVVGEPDTEMDVALLKVEPPAVLIRAPLGDSDKLRPGEWVYVIGDPFRLRQSITVGVVSGIRRDSPVGTLQEVFQVDAALNPGNSGGPVYNLNGEVVGVSVSILPGANTTGFVIPINDVLWAVEKLRRDGRVVYAVLGAVIASLEDVADENVAKKNGIPWPLPADRGIFIREVMPKSAAEEAGLKSGDVIISFNSTSPSSSTFGFRKMVSRSEIGVPLSVKVRRGSEELLLSVKLRERPQGKSEDAEGEEKQKEVFPNFGKNLHLFPMPVRDAIETYQGIIAEAFLTRQGEPSYRFANAFLVDPEYVVTSVYFLNENTAYAAQASYVFNKTEASLVAIDARLGLAIFKLASPDPRVKKEIDFSKKARVGDSYFSLILRDIQLGNSFPQNVMLVNRLGPLLEFEKRVPKIGWGAPLFDERGGLAGMWLTADNTSDSEERFDATVAIPAELIRGFVAVVKAAHSNEK